MRLSKVRTAVVSAVLAGALLVAGSGVADASGWVRHWDCYWRNLHVGTGSVSLASQLSYQGWSCYSNQIYVP